ncbi:MAG TPA: ATP-binding protein [Bryobacteraceae bacterium]|nr:ATP-binding protein [Bryobacteraceae bacterium]
MAEAVIFVGLQGSGKSTWFQEKFAQTHVHVSRDIQKTAAAETALIADCLKNGRSFVVDDTNATRQARAPFLRDAKTAGYRLIACFFDVPVRTAIGRNNHRKDKKPIPVPAILRTAKQIQKPAIEEGFDEVRTVSDSAPNSHIL